MSLLCSNPSVVPSHSEWNIPSFLRPTQPPLATKSPLTSLPLHWPPLRCPCLGVWAPTMPSADPPSLGWVCSGAGFPEHWVLQCPPVPPTACPRTCLVCACHCLHPGSRPSTQEGTTKGMSGGSRQPDALSGKPRGLEGWE